YHVDPTISSVQNLVLNQSFDPVADVDLANDTIHIDAHGLSDGQKVRYQVSYLGQPGTAIGNLTDGTDYYVITADANTVKLAATPGGPAIDPTAGAAGALHNLRATRQVRVGDTAIGGLEDGETYFVTALDANTIRLTASEAEALDAAPIDLTASGSG